MPRRLVLAPGLDLVRILQRAWRSLGIEVEDLGITSFPQTLTYVKKSGPGLGFAYVPASHNRYRHNGLREQWEDGPHGKEKKIQV